MSPQEGTNAVSMSSQPVCCAMQRAQAFFVFNLSCDENFALVFILGIKGCDLLPHNGSSRCHVLLRLHLISDK